MFGMPAGAENLNVDSTVEFDSLEQKETYESAACGPPRDSDLNSASISQFSSKSEQFEGRSAPQVHQFSSKIVSFRQF